MLNCFEKWVVKIRVKIAGGCMCPRESPSLFGGNLVLEFGDMVPKNTLFRTLKSTSAALVGQIVRKQKSLSYLTSNGLTGRMTKK